MFETILRRAANAGIALACRIMPRTRTRDGILLIKLEVVGDFVMSLPTIAHYRQAYPGKRIVLLIDHKPNEAIAHEMKSRGYVDEVMLLDSRRFSRNPLYRFSESLKISRLGIETAIYLTYYRRHIGDFLTRITLAPFRIGFRGYADEALGQKTPANLFTRCLGIDDIKTPEFEKNHRLLEFASERTFARPDPLMVISNEADRKASVILEENGLKDKPFAVIVPGAGLPFKMWPTERFAEIARFLSAQGLIPAVCGSPSETGLCLKMQSHCPETPLVNLAGKTSVMEMAAIFKKAKIYVGNDTGSVHVAAGVGLPIACIIGCGAYPMFFPYGDLEQNKAVHKPTPACGIPWKCMDGQADKAKAAPCIEHVTIDDVQECLRDLLCKAKKTT